MLDSVLALPTASVNLDEATFIVVAPSASGVNVAVYVVPFPPAAKVEPIEPFVPVTSSEAKLVVTSLDSNVTARVASFDVVPSTFGDTETTIVGAVVSIT